MMDHYHHRSINKNEMDEKNSLTIKITSQEEEEERTSSSLLMQLPSSESSVALNFSVKEEVPLLSQESFSSRPRPTLIQSSSSSVVERDSMSMSFSSSSSRRKRVEPEKKLASPLKMWRSTTTTTTAPRTVGLPLTFLLSLLLASILIMPLPVDSLNPTETGDLVTEDNNDAASNEFLMTTSSSVTPVKLQTITFTSGSSDETSSMFPSTMAAEDRSTPVELIKDSSILVPIPTTTVSQGQVSAASKLDKIGEFTGWKEHGAGSSSMEMENNDSTSSDDDHEGSVHKEDRVRESYEYKSAFPDLKNETREALQEEGSNHQPVVFVGGSGYVPPNSLRARPPLEAADPLWQTRPIETRYPVPHHSPWDRNYRNPFNMTRVQHIEAECQDDYMKIRVAFNGSFHGLIYSSGYSYDPDCVYVSGNGTDGYQYLIKLNRCGTLGASNHVEGRKEPSKNFMWNTVTVQYNPMIEEEWDEHFKVTCEYGYDFWKTVTFPFLDVEVATGNPVVFTLTPPECYMEIRYGFGTSGTRVGGPVRVGDPLTLMIYMRSQYDGFDIVVNDCYAHNGATKRIQLIDHYGCPVDSKLMSPFRGSWKQETGVYETQVFAYLKTFRFTGSPALYIECDVRMCHGQCPSQPCYWRNVKSIRKRSADSNAIESEKNSTLSENVSLFQSLRVLQEDEEAEASKSDFTNNESVCVKTGVFTATIGLSTLILVILSISTMIMCFRIRRVKSIGDVDATDILRPYSHHATPHHWSSPSASMSKR